MLDRQEGLYWLRTLARRWGLAEALAIQEPLFAWSEILGPQLAQLARALYVEGGTLHIGVASSVVANELRMKEDTLLTRLNAQGGYKLTRLRFHTRDLGLLGGACAPEPAIEAQDEQVAEALVPEDLRPNLRQILLRNVARAHARERALKAKGARCCARCDGLFCGGGELCQACRLAAPRGED